MHDIAFIRQNPGAFDAGLARRGAEPQADRILALDARRREVTTALQQAQSRRNEASKAIGQAMGQGDTEKAEALKAEVAEIKQRMPEMEEQDRSLASELTDLLARLPNLPAEDVPEGEDEDGNVEVSQWGDRREFTFEPKEHADLGPALGLDFETGTKLSGARFTFLRGDVARLHRALAQFMLDRQTRENGYTECNPPVLVNDAAMYGTDKLPKFAEDSFQTFITYDDEKIRAEAKARATREKETDPENFADTVVRVNRLLREENNTDRRWLVPTSEVPLTYSVAGEILDDLTDPIRMTAHTLCFRSEAGSAGRDTRGFIRQHQFEKVELVSICRPDDSEAEHERMTRCAEGILEAMNLPYRRMLLCSGDMGFGAKKTFDLEVWLPGQNAWREISSCSNTGDFQARRMNTRYRPEGSKKTEFVHTLNGSGLAVGRTLVAVLENYQEADGSVVVPEALLSYMGGVSRVEAQSR
ncbi:serine--tRNA ligase [Erythrobacter sp. HI0063]|jgi:seryl-tRNA synthetase|uniref:serine--tRNA ligase n=1 Tax=Erythrobacter sp. HI0063 TaxID=1822240 RepID=UPI0007C2368F|nr:serine--tRNA ligase [Erythrobacter sp. HI0063]KZY58283.1 serine--tRNA ligase [Erythrobacter sp. HI0063]